MAAGNVSPRRAGRCGCILFFTVSGGLVLLTVAYGALTRRTDPPGPLPVAVLWTATPTPPPTPTPFPPPTPDLPTPTPSADIGIGTRVQVAGTEIGLNLRAAPGTTADRVDVAQEGEIFIVVAGPAQADGLTWWQVRDENNPQREGWAAANFLAPW